MDVGAPVRVLRVKSQHHAHSVYSFSQATVTFTFDSVIGISDLFFTVMHAAAEVLQLTTLRCLLRGEI